MSGKKDLRAADKELYPSYLNLVENGELGTRIEQALALLKECRLCPRCCAVDRLGDRTGFCRTGRHAVVSSAVPHFGEEPCISGSRGSGTIFFTHCNLACIFCQNADISQLGVGKPVEAAQLADLMLSLQNRGCHNVNLVTPSHVGPQILEALGIAVERGLKIPIVWNSGGYDGLETLRLMEGVVDIYMPDLKYSRSDSAARLSKAPDYPERAKEALREMYRQVGDLVVDKQGVALRGLLVRHLVLPEDLAGTEACLRFLREELSPRIGLSLMSQYHPAHQAWREPALGRSLRPSEYARAVRLVEELGFEHAYVQGLRSIKDWLPDFSRDDPFQAYRNRHSDS